MLELPIDNQDELLTSRLYASVNFFLVPEEAYFMVTSISLIITNGGSHISVLDSEDKIKMTPVVLDRDYGKMSEITPGLKEQGHMIVNPDGEQVMELKSKQKKKNLGDLP